MGAEGAARPESSCRADAHPRASPGTRSLFLALPAGERLAFTPGQFISCALPVGRAEPLVRAYSLASSPEDAELEICVDRVANGRGSAYLFGLRTGARARLHRTLRELRARRAAAGAARVRRRRDRHRAAPADGAARARARRRRSAIDVLQGARYEHELLYRADFEPGRRRTARLHWEPVLRDHRGRGRPARGARGARRSSATCAATPIGRGGSGSAASARCRGASATRSAPRDTSGAPSAPRSGSLTLYRRRASRVHSASWKMMPSVKRSPLRQRADAVAHRDPVVAARAAHGPFAVGEHDALALRPP